MIDPKAMANEMDKNGTLRVVQQLAKSEEAKKLVNTVDQNMLRKAAEKQDPEVMRAVLQQLLASEDGKKLAQKVKAAMGNG